MAAKVCGMSKLMSDYGHGLAARKRRHKTARVRIRLLLFESKLRRLSTVYLQRRTVCVRYRSRSFWNEIAGNWSERESQSTNLG